MSSMTLEHVKGRDLQRVLAERFDLDPDRHYRVTVDPEDEELQAKSEIGELMLRMGRKARERGLTEE